MGEKLFNLCHYACICFQISPKAKLPKMQADTYSLLWSFPIFKQTLSPTFSLPQVNKLPLNYQFTSRGKHNFGFAKHHLLPICLGDNFFLHHAPYWWLINTQVSMDWIYIHQALRNTWQMGKSQTLYFIVFIFHDILLLMVWFYLLVSFCIFMPFKLFTFCYVTH